MKKLYLFMTALLVAIAANAADWYLVGDPTGSSYQWTDREAYKLTQTSDTEYYIDVESLNGTWKIKEGGTWDTSFGAYNVGDDVSLNTWANVKKNGENFSSSYSYPVRITIKYTAENGSLSDYQVRITKQEGQTGTTSYAYIAGGMNSWNTSDNAYRLTSTDGNIFTAEGITIEKNVEFKIVYEGNYYSLENTAMVNDEKYTCVVGGNDNNMKFAEKLENGKISFNLSAMQLTIGEPKQDPSDEFVFYANIKSPDASGNWVNDYSKHEMSGSDNVYTYEYLHQGKGGFNIQILKWKNGSQVDYYESTEQIGEDIALNTVTPAHSNGGKPWYFRNAKQGSTYIITFSDGTNPTVTLTEKKGEDLPSVTLYFNAGADYFNQNVLNGNPIYARFIKKGTDTPDSERYLTSDIRNDDPNAKLPIFYVNFTGDLSQYDGVQFECTNNGVTWTYNSKRFKDETERNEYDAANWWRFIYGPGKNVENATSMYDCGCDQSFITYDDYKNRRDELKEAIYISGSNLTCEGFSASDTSVENPWEKAELDEVQPDWNGNTYGMARESDGIYIFKVDLTDDNTDAQFKMSWINCERRLREYKSLYNRSITPGGQRWWATFNTGIVGPTLPPGMSQDQAFAGSDPVAKDNGSNWMVSFIVNRCRVYSRYNQYDWWIKASQIESDSFYVVIDTDNGTSALVPFNPQPQLSDVKANSPEYYGSVDDYAADLGNRLIGTAVAGPAYIYDVNTAVGSATVYPAAGMNLFDPSLGNAEHQPGYTAEYQIWHDDVLVTSFNGVKDAQRYLINFENMVTDNSLNLKLRTVYHDLVNGTVFRARTAEGANDAEGDYAAPEQDIANTNVTLFRDPYGWHAHVDVPFSIPVNRAGNDALAVYPDFDINVKDGYSKASGVRLATSQDWHVQNNIGTAHHTLWNDGEEYVRDTHNWSYMAISDHTSQGDVWKGTFHLVIENIVDKETDIKDLPADFEWHLDVHAAYPFLTDNLNQASFTPQKQEGNTWVDLATSNNGRHRAQAQSRESQYSVVPTNATTTFIFKAASNSNLSGITDAEVAEDGEAELYNLQGIRVQGEPAPGIYLRRCGNTTEKVVIR